ncbi:hypothetical protein ACQY0O_002281 [Thecaphora frezii]
MSASTRRKLKILMAHGYTSNSFMFSKRSGAIRRACRDVADFTFINGPLLVQPITDVSPNDLDAPETSQAITIDHNTPLEEQPRAWWRTNDHGEYVDWDVTVDYLNQVLANDGPFDAVWGFSQGGCLAGLLAAAFEHPEAVPGLKLPTNQGPFRFAIATSGFRSRDPVHQALFQQPIQTPVLHVLGRADHIVDLERSQTLVDVCANSRVELHDGGHALPSQAPWRNFFRDFIATFASDPYVPNSDWRTVLGPSDRPRGSDTPGASTAATPHASGTTTPIASQDPATAPSSSGEQPSPPPPPPTSSQQRQRDQAETKKDAATATATRQETKRDVDPSNPGRMVASKKANQPFLAHQRWKEAQAAKRAKQGLPPVAERKRDDMSGGGGGIVLSTIRSVLLGLAILVATGQFIAGDPLWGYRGKWVQRRTYFPQRERIFSLPELAFYNGRDPNKPVYIAILGDVYDVTAGRHIYGPGGSYEFFSGRDASRAYVTGCFKEHLTYDVRGFSDRQMKDLLNWKAFYDNSNKYHKVGRVVLPELGDDVPTPPDCQNGTPQK